MGEPERPQRGEAAWYSRAWLLLLTVLLCETGSGLFLFFSEELGRPVMAALYLHVGLGLAGAAALVPFLKAHRRTAGTAVGWARRLAHGSWLALLLSLLSGTWLFLAGVSGHEAGWLFHLVVSTAGLYVVACHVRFRAVHASGGRPWRVALLALVLAALPLGALILLVDPPAPALLQKALDDQALDPEALHVPGTSPPQGTPAIGRAFSKSRTCGTTGCHEAIYREWKESPHNWTVTPMFLRRTAELCRESGGTYGVRFCGTCHVPVAALSGTIEAVSNASPDDATVRRMAESDESISCVYCHSLRQAYSGRLAGAVVSMPREFVPGDGSGGALDFLYRKAVAMKPRAHARSYTSPLQSGVKACYPCHQDVAERWLASGYHRPTDERTCQSCHMAPSHAADDVTTRLRGQTASHRFVGNDLFNPERFGLVEQARQVRAFLADDRFRVQVSAPGSVRPGASMPVRVSILSNAVGHLVGMDLCEAWLEMRVTDARGREIHARGIPDRAGRLPRDAAVYTQFSLDDRLRSVTKQSGFVDATWFRVWTVNKGIPPGHVDDVVWHVPVPPAADGGPLRIQVALKQRMPGQLYLDWAFSGLVSPIAVMAAAEVEVAVRRNAPLVRVEDLPAAFAGRPRAAAYYVTRLHGDPSIAMVASHQAVADFEGGRREQALQRIQRLWRRYPGSLDVQAARAHILAGLGRLDEASAAVQALKRGQPGSPYVLRLEAHLLDLRGDVEGARRLRERAAEAQPRWRTEPFDPAHHLDRMESHPEGLPGAPLKSDDFPYDLIKGDGRG